MNKFLQDISSTYWWISVVIVGLALSIASSYLKSFMDTFLGRWSVRRRNKIADRINKERDFIAHLVDDPDDRQYFMHELVRVRINFTTQLILAFVIMIPLFVIKRKKSSELNLIGLSDQVTDYVTYSVIFLLFIMGTFLLLLAARMLVEYGRQDRIARAVFGEIRRRKNKSIPEGFFGKWS